LALVIFGIVVVRFEEYLYGIALELIVFEVGILHHYVKFEVACYRVRLGLRLARFGIIVFLVEHRLGAFTDGDLDKPRRFACK
jgi:hypothetical protein